MFYLEEEIQCRFFWVQFKWLGLSLGGGEIEQFLLGSVQVAEGDLGVGSGVGAEGQYHLHGPESGLHLGLILLLAWIR